VFKSWLKKAVELKSQEDDLHERLPEHLKTILRGKKLSLWKHILVSLGYSDAKIVDEVIEGFSLTGWAKESGVFDTHIRAAAMTVDQLKGVALGLNSAVVGGELRGHLWTKPPCKKPWQK